MNLNKNETCPLSFAMNIIGGKWKLSIICLLKHGNPMRYNQIKRGIPGITNVMLAESLKHLEKFDILERFQYNEVPVRVEYKLTKNGFQLLNILELLNQWSNQYIISYTQLRPHCESCILDKHSS